MITVGLLLKLELRKRARSIQLGVDSSPSENSVYTSPGRISIDKLKRTSQRKKPVAWTQLGSTKDVRNVTEGGG